MRPHRQHLALTSDFPSSPCPEVAELIRAASNQPRVAWIAPQASSRRLRFSDARRRFRALGIERLEFIDASRPPRRGDADRLAGFDVAYLTGGDPIRFREALIATGLGHSLRRFASAGALVVAASGGAMQLTPNVSLFRLLEGIVDDVLGARTSYPGLGLVNCEILPHLNRHGTSFLEKVRRYSEAIDHDVIALGDGAAVIWSGGEQRYVGEVVRYRAGISSAISPGGV